MNPIEKIFYIKKNKILSIYFTAGYPKLDSTLFLLKYLQKYNVDMVEIGIPYSDPIADGKIIQNSNKIAIENGITINKLFEQLNSVKNIINIPLIIMSYYNQFFNFGEEKFLKKCLEVGVSGIIIPDISPELFCNKYISLFKKYSILPNFLICPWTSDERIKIISKIKQGFLYIVSDSATTGNKLNFGVENISFFKRIKAINIKIPKLIGFGISNKNNFNIACNYSQGAIIGSAFINSLKKNQLEESVSNFIKKIY